VRSAGTPGGAAMGRPVSWRSRISYRIRLLPGSDARSRALGTSGSSGSLVDCHLYQDIELATGIQSGRDARMVDQDSPQIPSTSRLSTARFIPAPGSYSGMILNRVPRP
jgi:hypothetical protein